MKINSVRLLIVGFIASTVLSLCQTSELDKHTITARRVPTPPPFKSPLEAYTKVLPAALQGDPESQLMAAIVLADGSEVTLTQTGVPIQYISGVWLERAAIGGSVQAMYLLSDAYQSGWYGKPKEPSLAEYWAGKAKKKEVANNK